MGCGRRGDWPPAGAGPGGVPGGEESEAAAGGQRRWEPGQTPVQRYGQQHPIQGLGTTGGSPGAEGPIQQREREDQLEEEEESEGNREKEEEGTAGGGRHSDAVRG